MERFRREASSAAALSHPNIVGIFDRGEWNGTYYIAMEYVGGRSLKTIVREDGPLPLGTAIGIVEQILRAARFAHRRGVIHRDLKPHNVILDDEGRARVTDFGIARAGASDMTQTGSIMGTAQYLSPEQAQGYAVTEPSDLYSVGVILYELLTGVVPFEGETAVAIAFKQVSAEPRPPSELNPAVPAGLDAVVMRALAKDPAARFTDADEFIAALDREWAALADEAPPADGIAPAVAVAPAAVPLLMAPAGAYDGDQADLAPSPWRRRALWGLAIVLGLALVAVALILFLPSGGKVTVPQVKGRSEQAAGSLLRVAGLNPVSAPASSATVETGLVISESPVAGTVVRKGARVEIVVSTGPANSPLVSVEGLTAAQAVQRLRHAGFKPSTKMEASSTIAVGRVIGTEPSAGTVAEVGSHVTVIVSSGPAPVRVPDVTGETLSAAEAALTSVGLSVGSTAHMPSSSQPSGTILAQSPNAGTPLHEGGRVNLTIAQAPKEAAVPDVVGQSEALAAAALGEAGFKPKTVPTTATTPSQEGVVLAQAPPAGTRARKGSTVTIGVGALTPGTTTTTTPATTTTTTPPPSAGTG